MRIFKTCAYDTQYKNYDVIERAYPTKEAFIKELKANGYKVNAKRVAEKDVYDYIVNYTDATDDDFRKIKSI